ncbi:uncharacterized protein LOC132556779 [Ylistrum balloti]|uniref:uncharacterized protein LOC132556779 n=1 Tax=Ylistrum balloti TaxID=509963 RepID=UPI002905964F|nr:uncharacterized protein LOC132556779 [Ylistrum balloti]
MESGTTEQKMETLTDVEHGSDQQEPHIEVDGDNSSNKPGPEIQTDGSKESEMEIQIGAVFSLAVNGDGKQNETTESSESRTSFTGSTVSADEGDNLNTDKSEADSYVTNGLNIENNSMNTDHDVSETGESSSNLNILDNSNVSSETPSRSLSSKVTVEDSESIDSPTSTKCLNKSKKRSMLKQPIQSVVEDTKKAKYVVKKEDIITVKKFSYCYVKLFDVLKHSVIKQEVMKMDKKAETDAEPTTQDIIQTQQTHTRKKKAKKPARLTLKKRKRKTPIQDQNDLIEDESTQETPSVVTPVEHVEIRPSRKRKFNHNLFTDAVVFDSRGISNFEDHVIMKLEEEDSKSRTAPTYGFRGSRPQVARTKKKLCRVRREDMPFISVKLDTEQIEKIDKSKLNVSKGRVGRSISCLLDRRVRYYHNLQKISSGSFRILKNRSKSSYLKNTEKTMRKNRLKEKLQAAGSSKVTTKENIEKNVSTRIKIKKENTEVPTHGQKIIHKGEGNVGTSARLFSQKPNVSNPNLLTLPVNVKMEQSVTSSHDKNKDNLLPDEGRVSLTGRYRKPSNKYSSFITTFDRNWYSPKTSEKTAVNLGEPYIEMDIAADAESIVRQQQLGKVYKVSTSDENSGSVEMKNQAHMPDANVSVSPATSTTVVESLVPSMPKKVESNTLPMPNVIRKILPKDIVKPMKRNPTLPMKQSSMATGCANSSLFKNTVNELAKVQNTKKFFQLRVGDKMVLIPADSGDLVPKAYVIDIATNPSLMKSPAEKRSQIAEASSKQSGTGITESVISKKSESIERTSASASSITYPFPQSSNQQVTSITSVGGDSGGLITIDNDNNLNKSLLSPPILSPQKESVNFLSINSSSNPPVLSPKGPSYPTLGCDDAKPPVLHQEFVSRESENPNPTHMKSILPKLMNGSESSCLPVFTDGHSPPRIVVSSTGTDTLIVKKEPAHLRNFEADVRTKDTLSIKAEITNSLDSQSHDFNFDKKSINVTLNGPLSETKCENKGSESENSLTKAVSNEGSDLHHEMRCCTTHSSSDGTSHSELLPSKEDQKHCPTEKSPDQNTINSNFDSTIAAIDDIKVDSQSEGVSCHREPKDGGRNRDIFGIETVTHVPANETMVQERIRKLRERLREKQADLDNVRKTFRIKKEINEEEN